MFEELGPLSIKNGLILFQESLLSETYLMLKLLKYSFSIFRKMFKQRLRGLLTLEKNILF